MNAQERKNFSRAGSVLLFLYVCVCGGGWTERETYMDASNCNRVLGKYSFVQHEMLIFCSAGSHVIDSNTNLEHALTLIQWLNVSAGNNKLWTVLHTENRDSLFLRAVGVIAAWIPLTDAAFIILKHRLIWVDSINRLIVKWQKFSCLRFSNVQLFFVLF